MKISVLVCSLSLSLSLSTFICNVIQLGYTKFHSNEMNFVSNIIFLVYIIFFMLKIISKLFVIFLQVNTSIQRK